jgi:ATP-dependent exoDNAse (exonuclease V) beta subunit
VDLPGSVFSLKEKTSYAGLEAELELEKQEQTLDNLNLLYVAFTRAVQRLHIIATSAESNKQQLVNEWLEKYLANKFGAASDELYVLGEPGAALKSHRKHLLTAYELAPVAFTTDNSVIQIKSDYLKGMTENEDARRQGIVFHSILSNIRYSDDIGEALESAFIEGLIQENEINSYAQKISGLLDHPSLKSYFEKSAVTKLESELVTPNGEILRPDKIVFTASDTVILDYKTGKQNHKKYYDQMVRYENAVKSMGYSNIKKVLVYIDNLEVVEL